MRVKGPIKGLLETQAIQASLITSYKRYDRVQCLMNWEGERFQALAKEAVDILQSLNKPWVQDTNLLESH